MVKPSAAFLYLYIITLNKNFSTVFLKNSTNILNIFSERENKGSIL